MGALQEGIADGSNLGDVVEDVADALVDDAQVEAAIRVRVRVRVKIGLGLGLD